MTAVIRFIYNPREPQKQIFLNKVNPFVKLTLNQDVKQAEDWKVIMSRLFKLFSAQVNPILSYNK